MSNNKTLNTQLESAVNDNDVDRVRILLSAGADANFTRGWNVGTLLHFTYSEEIAKELLLRGANVNAKNTRHETPLHYAAKNSDNVGLVRELLKHKADVNATDFCGCTSLHNTVKRRHHNLGIVVALLEYGANVNAVNSFIETPLHCAAKQNLNLELVTVLLKHGALLDATDKCGNTPLNCAVNIWFPNLKIVEKLLEHGANVNAKNLQCETPLLSAVKKNINLGLVRLLLKYKADLSEIDGDGNTALDCAIKSGRNMDVIKELLKRGAVFNKRNTELHGTPLHYAAKHVKRLELVQLLLKHGAKVNLRDKFGNTPLDCAVVIPGNIATIQTLLENGAEIDIGNKKYKGSLCADHPPYAKLIFKYMLIKHFDIEYLSKIERWNCLYYMNFMDDCVREIFHMMADNTISTDISIHKLMMIRNPSLRTLYACNKKKLEMYYCPCFELDYYPIYQDMVEAKINTYQKRSELMRNLRKIGMNIVVEADPSNLNAKESRIYLNFDSTYYIAVYMSNEDLGNFITALSW